MIKKILSLLFLGINCMGTAQEIETIRIGDQVWMAKNVDTESSGSRCYNDLEENCRKFGRLYNWETATAICPMGFRLPADNDWTVLTNQLEGIEVAGKNLMEGGKSGFNALPGGNYNEILDAFSYQHSNGYYWTSTEFNKAVAWMRHFDITKTNINRSTVKKHYYFSVRCIRE